MDAATLDDQLDSVRSLLRSLPAYQPCRLVLGDDRPMLLVDTDDHMQTLKAMFLPGTVVDVTRPGTWRVHWCGIVVLVQEPLPEPAPSVTELKL